MRRSPDTDVGGGESSRSADVVAVRRVAVHMWEGRARSAVQVQPVCRTRISGAPRHACHKASLSFACVESIARRSFMACWLSRPGVVPFAIAKDPSVALSLKLVKSKDESSIHDADDAVGVSRCGCGGGGCWYLCCVQARVCGVLPRGIRSSQAAAFFLFLCSPRALSAPSRSHRWPLCPEEDRSCHEVFSGLACAHSSTRKRRRSGT